MLLLRIKLLKLTLTVRALNTLHDKRQLLNAGDCLQIDIVNVNIENSFLKQDDPELETLLDQFIVLLERWRQEF